MRPRPKKKAFEPGQTVMVQRSSSGGPWEPAEYLKKFSDWAGWHRVKISTPRHIDTMTGYECEPDNPRAIVTHEMSVPTRRVRHPRPLEIQGEGPVV